MEINANFTETVIVHTHQQNWITSPMQGVERKPLDRVGDEIARATSLVKYAPGSYFSPHIHSGGEEFIVLEGIFQDEHGDYPAGTYVRNPPQSSHTPSSEQGCTIFVKLWQFEPDDRHQSVVSLDTKHTSNKQALFENPHEKVFCVTLAPKEAFVVKQHMGLEVLVLAGEAYLHEDINTQGLIAKSTLTQTTTLLEQYTWLRQPIGKSIELTAKTPTQVWVKKDHLMGVNKQIERVNVIANT